MEFSARKERARAANKKESLQLSQCPAERPHFQGLRHGVRWLPVRLGSHLYTASLGSMRSGFFVGLVLLRQLCAFPSSQVALPLPFLDFIITPFQECVKYFFEYFCNIFISLISPSIPYAKKFKIKRGRKKTIFNINCFLVIIVITFPFLFCLYLIIFVLVCQALF